MSSTRRQWRTARVNASCAISRPNLGCRYTASGAHQRGYSLAQNTLCASPVLTRHKACQVADGLGAQSTNPGPWSRSKVQRADQAATPPRPSVPLRLQIK